VKKIFILVLALSSLFVAAHAAQAQNGGKAEPNRIEFKRGAHSATLKGRVRGDEEAEYSFGAGAGQAISINVSSVPANAIAVEVRSPNGDALELERNGKMWTGTLPEAGDYFMVVKLASGFTRRVNYTLTVTIK